MKVVCHTYCHTTTNDVQLHALAHLVSLMDGDEIAQAETIAHGNWYEHITGYYSDLMIEELN